MILGVFFILFGFAFQIFKLFSIIAGFYEISAEELEKYDLKTYGKAIRNLFILAGLINIVWYFFDKNSSIFSFNKIPFIISVVLCGLRLLVINPSNYLKK